MSKDAACRTISTFAEAPSVTQLEQGLKASNAGNPACQMELTRQIQFTTALTTGNTVACSAIMSGLDPASTEYRAFRSQQLCHSLYETIGDSKATDQLLAKVTEEDRDMLWRLRISIATGQLASTPGEIDSSQWRAKKTQELDHWKHTQAHPLVAAVKKSVLTLGKNLKEWGRAERDLIAKTGLIVIFGMPGAGKGTQAALYQEILHCEHLSTGDILRAQATGEQKERMAKGEILPLTPAEISNMVGRVFETVDPNLCLLDGYPRSVEQAEQLLTSLDDTTIAKMSVVHLKIDDTLAVSRILGRAKDTGRADDTEEAIRTRLEAYHQTTEPVLAYFKSRGVRVVIVDGNQPITDVFEDSLHQLLAPKTQPSQPLPVRTPRSVVFSEEAQRIETHQGRLRTLAKHWFAARNRSKQRTPATI